MTVAAPTSTPAARVPVLREATLLLGGRVLGGLASFAGVRILTAVMAPELYGRYALLVTFVGFVSGFLVAPFGQALNRFVHDAAQAGRMRQLVGDGLRITTAMSALGALATPVFAWRWLEGDPHRWLVAAILSVALLGANLRDRELGLFNTFRWRGRYVALYTADAWLRTIGVAGAVLWLGASLASAAAGLAVGTWLLAAAGVPWLLSLARHRPAAETGTFDFAHVRAYAMPLFGVNLLAWMLTSADRWVIERVLGAAELGRFVAAAQVASAGPLVVLNLCFPLFTPVLFQRMAEHPREPLHLDRFVLGIAAIGIALAGLVSVDVDAVFRVLVSGRSYDSGDAVVPFVAAGHVFNAIQQVAEHEGFFQRRPGRVMIASAAATCVSFLVNLTVTRSIGLAGAGVAACLTNATFLTLTVVVFRPSITRATWARVALLAIAMAALVAIGRAVVPQSLTPFARAPLRWLLVGGAFGLLSLGHVRGLVEREA